MHQLHISSSHLIRSHTNENVDDRWNCCATTSNCRRIWFVGIPCSGRKYYVVQMKENQWLMSDSSRLEMESLSPFRRLQCQIEWELPSPRVCNWKRYKATERSSSPSTTPHFHGTVMWAVTCNTYTKFTALGKLHGRIEPFIFRSYTTLRLVTRSLKVG